MERKALKRLLSWAHKCWKLVLTCSDILRICVTLIFQFLKIHLLVDSHKSSGISIITRSNMSGGWAEKLTNASASSKPNKSVSSLPTVRAETKAKKPQHVPSEMLQPNSFNSKEILQYLSTSYSTHIQQANDDKEGERVKLYRSLESSSQWNTKPSSTKIATATTNTPGANTKNKYNSKNVIRNQRDSHGKSSGNIDLLFELNRSIYQQQQHQQANKK